jgi:predicted GH43/DUF377 family glycosyl hydrolase
MNWTKLGKIFDPSEHNLPNGCLQYAQSPQLLEFDDFVRIYFSTRSKDEHTGKYLSHVAFVEMNKNLRDIIRVSEKSVIALGELGCFDEHGIFPLNVMRRGDAVYGYTTGWSRRVSVSVETSIGLAISHDQGITFERHGEGPVLTTSIHEPCLVGDGFVRVFDDIFHMWYIFGIGWKLYSPSTTPERTYKIGHATSSDGINWVKSDSGQIVTDKLGPDESQALPTVIKIDNRYHMFFCYRQSYNFRQNFDRSYRIGHAWSEDLTHWERDDEDPQIELTPHEWDSEMMCYPNVFEIDGKIYLLYNGNEFGRYGFGLAALEI